MKWSDWALIIDLHLHLDCRYTGIYLYFFYLGSILKVIASLNVNLKLLLINVNVCPGIILIWMLQCQFAIDLGGIALCLSWQIQLFSKIVVKIALMNVQQQGKKCNFVETDKYISWNKLTKNFLQLIITDILIQYHLRLLMLRPFAKRKAPM